MFINYLFLDTEHNTVITVNELFTEWKELVNECGTDCATFTDYIRECTSKNGTLEIIR